MKKLKLDSTINMSKICWKIIEIFPTIIKKVGNVPILLIGLEFCQTVK